MISYLFHNLEADRQVALKVLHGELVTNPDAVARFTREAEIAATLTCERVVRVHTVDQMEGIGPFVVMEYLQGAVLSQVIEARGPLAISDAVSFALDALEALEQAHALDILWM